jgi:hypothetical protein
MAHPARGDPISPQEPYSPPKIALFPRLKNPPRMCVAPLLRTWAVREKNKGQEKKTGDTT